MSFRDHLKPMDFAALAQTLRVGGDLFVVEFRGDTDRWMGLIFPNPRDLDTNATHLGNVIGKGAPISLQDVADYELIRQTLQLGDEGQLDIAEVAKLHRDNPPLYLRLLSAANIAIGNANAPFSGHAGWTRVVAILNEMLGAKTKSDIKRLMRNLQAVAREALTDFHERADADQMIPKDDEIDKVIDLASGN